MASPSSNGFGGPRPSGGGGVKGLLAMFENGNNSPSGSPKNTPPPVPGDITRSRSYGKVKTKLVAVKLEDGRMGMADASALERQATGESGSSGSPVSPQKGFGDSSMRKWERPELKGVQKDVVEEKKVETEFGQALLKSRTKEEEEPSVPEAPIVSPSSLKPTIKDEATADPKPEPKPLKIDLKSVEIAPKTEEKQKSPRFNLKPVEVAPKVEEKATSPKIALKPVEKKVEVVETPKVVEKVLPKEEPKEAPKEEPKVEEPKVEEKKAEVKEPRPKKEEKPKVQPAAKAQKPASTTARINKPKDITIPKIGAPRTPLIRSPIKDKSPTKETKPKLVAKAETSKPATTARPARKNLTVPTSSAPKSRGSSPAPSPLTSPTKPPPKSPFFRPASQAAPRKKVTAPVEAPKPKKAPVPTAATKARVHPAPVHSTKPLTKPSAPKLQNKTKIVIAHKADPKPEPKDVTKPVELHGSAFAPTASWVAKHGPDNMVKPSAHPESLRPDSSAGRSPGRSLRRQNSSISDRSRSHPNVRSPSRRPATSVGKRSDGSPSSSHSALSTDFLTRMSRPTQSSAAKVRDPSEIHTPSRGSSIKSLSPPRRQISPRPERTKDLNVQPLAYPEVVPEMPMDTAAFEVKDLQKAVQEVADEAAAKESLVEESAHEGSDNTPTMEPDKLSPPPSEDADDSAVDLSVVEEGYAPSTSTSSAALGHAGEEGARSPIQH